MDGWLQVSLKVWFEKRIATEVKMLWKDEKTMMGWTEWIMGESPGFNQKKMLRKGQTHG